MRMNSQYSSTDVLIHHGIKGQKWGVRRPRNQDGIIQGAGKQLAQKMKAYKQERKENKETKQKEKAANKESRKELYKNIAKGAAIAGGVAAAGYAAKLGAEELQSRGNYKKAKNIANDIVKSKFNDMSDAEKDVVKRNLTNANYRNLNRQSDVKRSIRAQQVKDAANAYLNPKKANRELRDEYRQNARSGKYSTSNVSKLAGINTITKDNIDKYETGLRRSAQQEVNPNAFEQDKRRARAKAESNYQRKMEQEKSKANSAFDEMAKKIKEDEKKKEANMGVRHSYIGIANGNYLSHHGIKGQKWGVRRFQNADGSYTSAGKARRNSSGTKKRGLSDNQKKALALVGSIALNAAVVGAVAYATVNDPTEFDRTVDVLTGSAMKQQINATNNIAKNYEQTARIIHHDPNPISPIDGKFIKDRVNKNLRTADETLRISKKQLDKLENKKSIFTSSKRRQEKLESARKNVSDLETATQSLHYNADLLKNVIDASSKKTGSSNESDNGSSRSYSQSSGRYSSQSSGRSYTRQPKQSTAKTKSTDRVKEMKNSKVKVGSVAEESKNVRNMAKKVQEAQKNGTLTPQMVEELQNAKARKKMAVEQEQMSHGFICFINSSDYNSLMHSNINARRWRVRRNGGKS